MRPDANRRIARPDFGFSDALGLGWQGWTVAQLDPAAQLLECRLARGAFHLDPIGFRLARAWVGQLMLQFAVVGEKQQAFAVLVEPAGGVNTVDGQNLAQAVFASELTGYAIGLVEQNDAGH